MKSLTLMMTWSALALTLSAGVPAMAHQMRKDPAPRVRYYDRIPYGPFASGDAVILDGRVIGADPDPFIRQELRRDTPHYRGQF